MVKDVTFGNLWNESIDFFKKNFLVLFLVGFFLYFIPRFYIGYNNFIIDPREFTDNSQLIAMIISLAATSVFSAILTVTVAYSIKIRKRALTFGEVLSGASKYYINAVILSIILAVALVFLFMLLVIPGIIFLIFWVFSLYVLVLEDTKIIESMKKSMEVVSGRWWNVLFMIVFVLFVMWFINVVLLIALNLFNFFGLFGGSSFLITTNLISMITTLFSSIFLTNYYLALRKN